ncbi:MAG: O-antigen ligase family protein [Candidatus Doudnabacteria bacterium]|nr:O-antigen ligase family protein [Candidatus Doudnabacteria bacterium]
MTIFIGLILALLPSYLLRFNIFGIPTTFLEILIVVFLLAVFVSNHSRAWTVIKQLGKINYAIGLFVAAAVISTIISPEPIKALGQLKTFIIEPVLFFYAVVSTVNSQQSTVKLLRWLFAGAVLISLFGLIQSLTNLGLPLQFWGSGLEPKRITSFFEYPNALALYLAPLFSLFFILWWKNYAFMNRRALTFGLILILIALILTFSRGAWLAVMISLVVPWWFKQSLKNKLAALLLVIIIGILPPIKQRLIITDYSAAVHFDLIKVGIKQIGNSPILGNGLYGFRTTQTSQGYTGEVLNYPHNIVLNFWLELGLLGLLGFAAVVWYLTKQYKKRPTAVKLAALIFVSTMLIHGLVDVPYFKNDLSVLFWFVASIFYFDS